MKFIKKLSKSLTKRQDKPLNLSLKERIENLNRPIWLSYVALLVIGFLAVMSSKGQPTEQIQTLYSIVMMKQLFIIGVSVGITFLIQTYFPRYVRNHLFMWLGFIMLLILLILVLLVGKEVNGAKSWLPLFSFQLQPSEFIKPFVIWWLSVAFFDLSKNKFAMSDGLSAIFKRLPKKVKYQKYLVYGVPLLLMILTEMQPDFGTFVIIGGVVWCMILISNRFKSAWFWTLLLAVAGIGIVWFLPLSFFKFLQPHKYARFLAFRQPFLHTEDASYQMIRGLMAISRGGLIGVGPGASLFKTGYLPEASTDFIMAIVAEEYGIFGMTVVFFILVFLINYLLYQSLIARDLLTKYVLFGVGCLFFIQSFINLGGLIGLIPLTGVTLPFISYGGSSSLASSVAIGLALGILEYGKEQQRIGRQVKTRQLSRERVLRKEKH